MLKWIIGNSRMLLLVAALLSATALGSYWMGRLDERSIIEGKANEQAVKDVKKAQEIQLVIQRMPKNEVQKLLEKKWCRDCQ